MKIETFLPVFPGFYGSIFDADSDIEDFLYEEGAKWEQLEFDNEEYQNDVSEAACSELEYSLSDFVSSIKFQSLQSPKYYNFSNDSINCEIVLLKCDIKAIKDYVFKYSGEFKQYLKDRYTSRSGFMSFHSNNFEDWCEYTQTFTNYKDNAHYLGAVLEFICQNEEIDQEHLYYGIRDQGISGEMYCSIKEIESENV